MQLRGISMLEAITRIRTTDRDPECDKFAFNGPLVLANNVCSYFAIGYAVLRDRCVISSRIVLAGVSSMQLQSERRIGESPSPNLSLL